MLGSLSANKKKQSLLNRSKPCLKNSTWVVLSDKYRFYMCILIRKNSNPRCKSVTPSPQNIYFFAKSVISTSSDIQNHDFDDDFLDDDFLMMIFHQNHHQKSSSKSWFWISDDVDITDLDLIVMDFGDDVDIFERWLLSEGLIWAK